jgi:hypothetical protein
MADPADKSLQDQIFEMVQRSQEVIIDASRNFVDGAADLAPGDREAIDRLIDSAFDLTERILQAQRDFAKTVLNTVTLPGRPGDGAGTDSGESADAG